MADAAAVLQTQPAVLQTQPVLQAQPGVLQTFPSLILINYSNKNLVQDDKMFISDAFGHNTLNLNIRLLSVHVMPLMARALPVQI